MEVSRQLYALRALPPGKIATVTRWIGGWVGRRECLGTIFLPLAHLFGSSLPYWSTGLITQFLDYSQAVGLIGRVISSSQGLYLNAGQHKHRKTRTHIKHPCPGRDSNRKSRTPSNGRLSMPQTARLPRPALNPIERHLFAPNGSGTPQSIP
jgi:hypothetical protein